MSVYYFIISQSNVVCLFTLEIYKQQILLCCWHNHFIVIKFMSHTRKFQFYSTMVIKTVVRMPIQNITNCNIMIKINSCFIESRFIRVSVKSMGRIFKGFSRISHENSKQYVQKCEAVIFQKGVSIKFWKFCTCSYYSIQLLV